MIELNFVAIGKIPGEAIFVHKNDAILLSNGENTGKIMCIAVDFRSRKTSVPVVIDYLLNVCPHDAVISETEREALNEMVTKALSVKKLMDLIKRFDKIRYKESVKFK